MRQPCASFAMHSSVQVFLNISGGGGCVVFTGKSGKPRRAGSPPPGKDADTVPGRRVLVLGQESCPALFSWLELPKPAFGLKRGFPTPNSSPGESLSSSRNDGRAEITLPPIPAGARHLSPPGPGAARRVNLLPKQLLPREPRRGQLVFDAPGSPQPARETSPTANKTLAALRDGRGFIRYLPDTHLAVRAADLICSPAPKLLEEGWRCRPSLQPPPHMAPVQSCLGVGARWGDLLRSPPGSVFTSW